MPAEDREGCGGDGEKASGEWLRRRATRQPSAPAALFLLNSVVAAELNDDMCVPDGALLGAISVREAMGQHCSIAPYERGRPEGEDVLLGEEDMIRLPWLLCPGIADCRWSCLYSLQLLSGRHE